MSADRLVRLVWESVSAGVAQTADGLGGWAAQRAPDLVEAARGFGDLAQRGLVGPLDSNAIAPQEDVPIAADLSARLGIAPANAHLAITAARLLSKGGLAPGQTAAFNPAAAPAPTAPKPLWQQWWVWALAAVGAYLLYNHNQKPAVPQPGPTQAPFSGPTGQTPPFTNPTTGPTNAPLPPQPPVQNQGGGAPALSMDRANLPTLGRFDDRDNNRIGVIFRYNDVAGPIEAIVAWPRAGLTAGTAEFSVARPGQRISSRGDLSYTAYGTFKSARAQNGTQMNYFEPGEEVSSERKPLYRIVIVQAPAAPGGPSGEILCAVHPTGNPLAGCGVIPAPR